MTLLIVCIILGVCIVGLLVYFAHLKVTQSLTSRLTTLGIEKEMLQQTIIGLRLSNENLIHEKEHVVNEYINIKAEHAALFAQLEQEKIHTTEKLEIITQAQEKLTALFKAISQETLKSSQEQFFEVAEKSFQTFSQTLKHQVENGQLHFQQVVNPLHLSLEKVDRALIDLEKARLETMGTVSEQIRNLMETSTRLEKETHLLATSLKSTSSKGRWGELQLLRILEMAGMKENIDFQTQVVLFRDDNSLRPDVVLHLPKGKKIAIDAKAPLDAFLSAYDHSNETKNIEKMVDHAKNLRRHIAQLGEKSYAQALETSFEFVVLFLPLESLLGLALEVDPEIFEYAFERQVVLATPVTLIALVKTVAYAIREEAMTKNTEVVAKIALELYERLLNMNEHFSKMKRSLDSTIDSYNKMSATFESRVLVSARKFRELGVFHQEELMIPETIEKRLRTINVEEQCIP